MLCCGQVMTRLSENVNACPDSKEASAKSQVHLIKHA